jgi:hypothetical protein
MRNLIQIYLKFVTYECDKELEWIYFFKLKSLFFSRDRFSLVISLKYYKYLTLNRTEQIKRNESIRQYFLRRLKKNAS